MGNRLRNGMIMAAAVTAVVAVGSARGQNDDSIARFGRIQVESALKDSNTKMIKHGWYNRIVGGYNLFTNNTAVYSVGDTIAKCTGGFTNIRFVDIGLSGKGKIFARFSVERDNDPEGFGPMKVELFEGQSRMVGAGLAGTTLVITLQGIDRGAQMVTVSARPATFGETMFGP
jgi:hypothetical protein